jgi:uncharacterized protein
MSRGGKGDAMQTGSDLKKRIGAIDWSAVAADLRDRGYARVPALLAPRECAGLIALYREHDRFRKTIDMAAHRFGAGEYRYFARPLPPPVQALRLHLYPPLARIANGWRRDLGGAERFPRRLGAFLDHCRAAGQERPTPLLLRYSTGGYNCLHQDLYGRVAFPLQVTVLLSRRGADFTGGQFLLVENRPRAQSAGHSLDLDRGEAVIFPTRERPVAGRRGWSRAGMRHGVSPLLSGWRYTLGIIFHDAA